MGQLFVQYPTVYFRTNTAAPRDGHPVTSELAACLSPYVRKQIRRFGRFSLDMEDQPDPLNPMPLPFEWPK